jgi:hypothetical protein
MILRQILDALDLLHQSDIAHGNLGAENIQFVPAKLEYCPEKSIHQIFGEGASEVFPVCRKDGKIDKWAPRYQVQADPLDELEVDNQFQSQVVRYGGRLVLHSFCHDLHRDISSCVLSSPQVHYANDTRSFLCV